MENEEDPARFVYHRTLKAAAVGGVNEAEAAVEEMARAGHVPGPRAYHALGEAEGLQLNEALVQALLEHHCAQHDVQAAAQLLADMRTHGLRPGLQHYSPLILLHAELGDPQASHSLLEEMLQLGTFQDGLLPVCTAVLDAQLRVAQSPAEVASHVLRMKAMLLRNSLQPSQRFLMVQLQAALRLQDLQSALQAYRSLRQRGGAVLTYLDEDTLAQLLLQISHAGLPAELYDLLAVMAREDRALPAAAMVPDERGFTILGAWVQGKLDQGAGVQQASRAQPSMQLAASSSALLVIDGVSMHPQTLVALDAGGAPLAVSRMGVRELRAELAARKAPVSGNKKDLAKRVQKLRALDDARASMQKLPKEQKADNRRKVQVVVTDAIWQDGKLVQETRYESEREGAASAKRAAMSEEDLFDDEDSAVQAEYEAMRYVLSSTPTFSSAQAGAHDAATIVLGAVVDLHAEPSPADLQALAAFVRGAGDVAAAVLVVAALDSLAAAGLGGAAAGLRQDLAAWCSEHEVDVEAAVDSVLHKDKVDDPLLQEIEGQLADLLGDEVPVPV
ncbi:plastid transcriptionally active 3 [Micractinium conductrix]|uniref:Plastid transcriptionally active 3 n=1 Tax=Micractinium conductrix TaxID=554055 RepID=A0A2P6UYV0_9CHLO|nr:plastid transcriptionally active 3 [Micractinium conductrix]|eukprot:PSC67015.1 plastid transcriptionally active 3 [Micractinium conductrix]